MASLEKQFCALGAVFESEVPSPLALASSGPAPGRVVEGSPALVVDCLDVDSEANEVVCDLDVAEVAGFGEGSSGEFAFDFGVSSFGVQVLYDF